MNAIEKLLADGWQELELGQPDWRWFIRGEENAYFYNLTGKIFFGQSLRDVIKKYELPVWAFIRGGCVLRLYYCDLTEIKCHRVVGKKIREGSGNFQSNMFKKLS